MSLNIPLIDKIIEPGARPSDVTVAVFEIEKMAKELLTRWGPDAKVKMHIKLDVEKEKPDGD